MKFDTNSKLLYRMKFDKLILVFTFGIKFQTETNNSYVQLFLLIKNIIETEQTTKVFKNLKLLVYK